MSIIFSSEISRVRVEPEDRDRVEKFLKNLMIQEDGMYTLIGSKPMTLFSYVPVIDEEEKKEIYHAQSDAFRKKVSLEAFQPLQDDVKKLWRDWKRVEGKYLGSQFLIREDAKLGGGIFINIPSVTFILDKYYREFSEITGQEYDPHEAVYLIGNERESFWRTIIGNHYLLGLLLGYGEKNAKFFQWEKDKKRMHPLRRASFHCIPRSIKGCHELTVEDLDIPRFVCYQPMDEVEEKYEWERKKFLLLYQGQDFCSLTIDFLNGIQPMAPKNALSEREQALLEQRGLYNSKW